MGVYILKSKVSLRISTPYNSVLTSNNSQKKETRIFNYDQGRIKQLYNTNGTPCIPNYIVYCETDLREYNTRESDRQKERKRDKDKIRNRGNEEEINEVGADKTE